MDAGLRAQGRVPVAQLDAVVVVKMSRGRHELTTLRGERQDALGGSPCARVARNSTMRCSACQPGGRTGVSRASLSRHFARACTSAWASQRAAASLMPPTGAGLPPRKAGGSTGSGAALTNGIVICGVTTGPGDNAPGGAALSRVSAGVGTLWAGLAAGCFEEAAVFGCAAMFCATAGSGKIPSTRVVTRSWYSAFIEYPSSLRSKLL
jgi:hypothetical protein